MKAIHAIAICVLWLATPAAWAQGPQWSSEQVANWMVVKQTWQKDQQKDLSWIDRQVLPAASMSQSSDAVPSALAHVRWSAVYQRKDKHERGRCSDTLVRHNGSWQCLGWSCVVSGKD